MATLETKFGICEGRLMASAIAAPSRSSLNQSANPTTMSSEARVPTPLASPSQGGERECAGCEMNTPGRAHVEAILWRHRALPTHHSAKDHFFESSAEPEAEPAPVRIAVAIPCFNEAAGDRGRGRSVSGCAAGCGDRRLRQQLDRRHGRDRSRARVCASSRFHGKERGTWCERPSRI